MLKIEGKKWVMIVASWLQDLQCKYKEKFIFPWLYMVNFVREVLNKMINEWIKLGIIIKNKGINMGFM